MLPRLSQVNLDKTIYVSQPDNIILLTKEIKMMYKLNERKIVSGNAAQWAMIIVKTWWLVITTSKHEN